MLGLTDVAHACVRHCVRAGDAVVDATVGNGQDTLFLADQVGAGGVVFGFEVQAVALANAARRLGADRRNVTLFPVGHEEMTAHVPDEYRGHLAAVMFNLGYLPGGDRSITTRTATTRVAVRAALDLIRPRGVITVMAYRGHAGGADELNAVRDDLTRRAVDAGDLDVVPASASPVAPLLFVFRKWKAIF